MSDLTSEAPDEVEDWDAWAQQDRDRLAQARQSPHPQGETPEPAQRGTKRTDSIPMETHMNWYWMIQDENTLTAFRVSPEREQSQAFKHLFKAGIYIRLSPDLEPHLEQLLKVGEV